MQNTLLPLAVSRDDVIEPFDDRTRLAPGDEVYWLVLAKKTAEWQPWLEDQGWERVAGPVLDEVHEQLSALDEEPQ